MTRFERTQLVRRYRQLESIAKVIARRGVYSTMEYNPYDELAYIAEEQHEIAVELGWETDEEQEDEDDEV